MNSIFVQIASYRDPQLIPTIDSLLDNAKSPENLHVCICWQHGDDEPVDIFLSAGFNLESVDENPKVEHSVIRATYKGARFSIIDTPYLASKGACWARNQVQQLYDNEKYTLQLDSHHRFVSEWDVKLIDMIEGLRHKSKKPLITAYVPSFDPENDPAGRVMQPWKMDFDRFIPEGAVFFIPSTIDDYETRTEPLKARFYSAHFAFADGSFAVEVQHDPEYFFHGEEISITVRAFTHGYDLYHPHIVVAWHEYTRKNRVKIWDDHTPEQKVKKKEIEKDWVERNNECHLRNRILFGMDGLDPKRIDFGKYGFGKERTVRQYEEYAGISFAYRGVQQRTLDRLEPPNNYPYTSEREWRESFVRSNDVRILFNRSELGELCDDYDFWYVGSADSKGNEIFRKDAQAHEIREYIKNEWIDFRLVWHGNVKPVTFVVWPHSASKGWLGRIEKPVFEY